MHDRVCRTESLESRTLLSGGGEIDAAFGDDGVVAIAATASNSQLTDLAVMSDGRFVMTGTSTPVSGGNQLTVRRFNPDGSPDTSFGTNGAATSVIGGNAQVFGVAIQPDNEIIVCGSTGNNYFLLRYLTNGKHDKTFGNGGLVSTNFNANRSVGRGVVINDDGTIVVGGTAGLANGSTAVGLAKYSSTGSIVQSFGSFGTLVTKFSFSISGVDTFSVTRMTADNVGNFVLSGRYFNGSLTPQAGDDALAVMRITPNGSPDPTFSSDGLALADFSVLGESATGVSIDAQNRPTAAVGGVNVFAALRLLNNGKRDSTFGINGLARVSTSSGDTNDVLVDDEGEVVLAGSLLSEPRLGRLNSNGSLDDEFGSDGITSPPVPFKAQVGLNRVVDSPDNTYLLGGTGGVNQSSGREFSLAKYFSQNEPVGTLNAKNLNAPQTSSYVFQVQWRDPVGINTTTLGNGNLRVTGPNGYARNAVLVSIDTSLGISNVTAKYKVAPPDSSWGSEDNGTYTVFVNANQVADLDGDFAPAGALGTFQVSIS